MIPKVYKVAELSSNEMFLILQQNSYEIKQLEYSILNENTVDFEYSLYQSDSFSNHKYRYGRYMPFPNDEIRKLLGFYFIFPKGSILYYTYELPSLITDWHGSEAIVGLTHFFSSRETSEHTVVLFDYLFTIDNYNLVSYFFGNFNEISLTFR